MAIIYVYGPAGSGKSRNAEKLRIKLACYRVIDEWPNDTTLKDCDLVLGQRMEDAPVGSLCLSIEQALFSIKGH